MKKNLIPGSILVVTLLIIMPSIMAKQLETVNNKNDTKGSTFKVEIYSSILNKNKNDFMLKVSQLYLLVISIEKIFKNHPEFKNLCKVALEKLNIFFRNWPAIMCFTLMQIYWVIDEISYYLIYDLGFPILGEIIESRLRILEFIYLIRCDWMYPYYSDFTDTMLISSTNNPCPCMNDI